MRGPGRGRPDLVPRALHGPEDVNEPALTRSIDRVNATLDRLEAEGVEPERTVFGGFSQGGCVACDALAQRPRKLAALVVLCGGLIGATEDEITKPPAGSLDGMPALITGTVDDEWIPEERVERTAEIFEAAGAQVTLRIHPPAPHEVHDAELEELRRLLAELRDAD